jgi:hypothetical protein
MLLSPSPSVRSRIIARLRVAVLLSVSLATLAPIQTSFAQTATVVQAEAAAPFTILVGETLANFAAWDRDHDGTLSEGEIDRLLTDPQVKGKDAAAAAALKISMRSRKYAVPPITREYLLRFDRYASKLPKSPSPVGENKDRDIGDTILTPTLPKKADSTTSDSASANPTTTIAKTGTEFPPMERIRRLCMQRIRRAKGEAFTAGPPRLRDVHQGQLGDCYFLAVLGGMVNRDPEQVHQMIVPSTEGGFDVRFPATKATHVPAFTDGEIALSSSASDSGRWVAIFEAAFGSVRNDLRNPGKTVAIKTDAIRDGGTITATIEALTGHDAKRFGLRKASVKEMLLAEQVANRLPILRTAITDALKEKRLACVSTNTNTLPPGISPKHAYAILHFDAEHDRVTIWNPHGNQFTPKGEAGVENGYPTKDGVFTVPLSDLARIFSGVTVETAAAPTSKAAV